MKVVLPVAGKGTRLRPHTHTRAKSLVNVAGKTVLEHIIERLSALDVDEFIFITDENGEQIEAFMSEHFPRLVCSYYIQQDRLGPAHAVALAAPSVTPGDDLLVVFNDTIFVTDLTRIGELCHDADGLIYSHEVEDYQRFGVNVMQGDYIVDMVEKPDTPVSRLAQVGLYYLKDGAGFIDAINAAIEAGATVKGEYYLPAVFMRMIAAGKKFKAPQIDAWLDCGKPETLLETNRYLLKGRHHIHGDVTDCVLIEPVHVEKGARIRHSIVGPNVSVAAGSDIDFSTISDSIINAGCKVSHMALHQSLLGNSVTLIGAPRQMNIGDHSLIIMDQ
ncbi:MAG: sugar phosphate nucleotidyltransferase [Pelovirga sp.]